ncbi:putative transcription factor C2H2 family [Medicago truncatula]|uniref:Putative transcription factor C2H2 family n=1 Tax=Medicago truncatula TaxID=3880 RepID=A0A396GP78_MEDTR|nr:putative transcription factor C2H2 family [Medicago truncatula]
MQNLTEINHQQNTNIPLQNLSQLSTEMDSIQSFISQSIQTNTLLPKQHLDSLSNQISSTIRQVIINATALLATCPEAITLPPTDSYWTSGEKINYIDDDMANLTHNEHSKIVELDAMELLAKHFHFCEICGKGFTRDANLRMHMRAHGEQFKTHEALRSVREKQARLTTTRFSCPYEGCKRNRLHKKFNPLKSVFCLRNHFKRSHCPKTHTCDRCRRKSFAVVSDLKSHVKQCRGESTWKCSCGTTFSRKEKLFGHVERFEGHSPAIVVEKKGKSMTAAPAEEEGVGGFLTKENNCMDALPEGFFDDLDKFWV